MSLKDEVLRRAQEYSQRQGLALGDRLGAGVHGTVFATEGQPKLGQAALRSAVKIHEREEFYRRERDVYLRLKEHGVTTVRGCEVPQMLRYDDQL